MPATWAELRGCLAALLDHLATPSSAVLDDERVMDAIKRWQALAADLPPLPPDDQERTELLGLLRRLGPALAGLDAPLQQLLQGLSDLLDSTGSQLAPAVLLFDAAMLSFRAARKVGKHAGATAEDLVQLGCCTPLLLGTGRLVAEWAAEAVRLSPAPDHARSLLSDVVANQLDVLATLIDEMYRGGVLGSFAAHTAPPQALLAWLRAVVAVQQSVPLSCCDQLTGMTTSMGLLTDYMRVSQALQPHREALEADAALCSSLVGTMLRSLGAAAVALRLPTDRQPAGLSWEAVGSLTYRFVTPTLCPALQQHLQQADRPALLALVQQAAAVLQHLPSAPPEGCSHDALAHAHAGSINLLVTVAAEAMKRVEPVRRQVLQLLLPTLPQLTAALQLAAALGNGMLATMLCGCWTNLARTMRNAVFSAPSTSSIIRQQLAAATDMLRTLPTAAACAQQLAQPAEGQVAAQAQEQQPATTLGQAMLGMTQALLLRVRRGECNPQLFAAAREAHEACCRAIHWAAASHDDAPLLLAPGDGGLLKPLLGLLGLAGNAVAKAQDGLQGELSVILRAVQGTCAAHWAAVQAAMAAGGASVLQMDNPMELTTLAISLLFCADYGPQAVRSSTEFLALRDQLLRSLLAGLPENQYGLLETALHYGKSAQRLAACLVASGTLEVVVSGLRSRHGTDKASRRWLTLAPAFVGVLKAVHVAAHDELGAVDKPPEVVQAIDDLFTIATTRMGLPDAAAVGRRRRAEQIWAALLRALQPAATVAAALQAHWQRTDTEPERQQAAQLELAQAGATRASCAHLACPNVGATGQRGKLCTGCRVARYCCRACSVADWRAGHRATCRLLAAGRSEEASAEESAVQG